MDWAAAAEALFELSRSQVARFLGAAPKGRIYGFGFFCDSYAGIVYLVANTSEYHCRSLHDYTAKFGPIEEELFKWDIGNWQYPGGLFPSASPDQREFDSEWEKHGQLIAGLHDDSAQPRLEEICAAVLDRLVCAGAFEEIPNLEATIVCGLYDRGMALLAKKKAVE